MTQCDRSHNPLCRPLAGAEGPLAGEPNGEAPVNRAMQKACLERYRRASMEIVQFFHSLAPKV